MIPADVYGLIAAERARQQWLKEKGRFAHTCRDPEMSPGDKFLCLVEEVGEVATALLNEHGEATDPEERRDLKKELVQVAAVCVAWLEGL